MGNTKNSCSELIAQLRNYKLHESPYNTPYLEGTDTPLKWWNTCFATQSQLQNFAIKLFSITPHAASCERIWSSVGWIYGKRQTRLSIQTIEALAKIHRYYLTNAKKELHYSQPSISNDKIVELVKESLSEGYEESFEEDESVVLSNLYEPEVSESIIENEKLEILDLFDLEPIVVIEHVNISQIYISESEIESDNNDSDEKEFDVENLVYELLN